MESGIFLNKETSLVTKKPTECNTVSKKGDAAAVPYTQFVCETACCERGRSSKRETSDSIRPHCTSLTSQQEEPDHQACMERICTQKDRTKTRLQLLGIGIFFSYYSMFLTLCSLSWQLLSCPSCPFSITLVFLELSPQLWSGNYSSSRMTDFFYFSRFGK